MGKESKYCGDCCYFCFEQTDGEGQCAAEAKALLPFVKCNKPACNMHVSRKEMRHHMAVLLQGIRSATSNYGLRKRPSDLEIIKASLFAYKYMKCFKKFE